MPAFEKKFQNALGQCSSVLSSLINHGSQNQELRRSRFLIGTEVQYAANKAFYTLPLFSCNLAITHVLPQLAAVI